jgi:tRNA-dihydrouridine synthase A
LFGVEAEPRDPFAVVEGLEDYVAAHLEGGGRLSNVTRHMLGLFNGRPGARAFRRHLSTEGMTPGAGLATLREAVSLVRDRATAEAA